MPRQPKYCCLKPKNLAYVRIDGKVIYLGKFGSPESRDHYDAEILKWRKNHDVTAKHSTTVGQLCLAFIEHAETFYRDKDGNPTGEANNFRKALRPLVTLYRSLPAAEFGPRRMLDVQEELASVHVRSQANKNLSRIKTVFRWGVTQEMVPADVIVGLECVRGLRPGRGSAREGEPVEPVPDEDFERALPLMTPNVAAICRLLLLTGARVSEIRQMRVGDLDTTGDVWLFRPDSHKNAWRGKSRTIFIGPQGQALLMPFVGDEVQGDLFVFRPRTDVNKPYSLNGLGGTIRKVCIRAKVKHWSPGQLRHNTATNVRRKYGNLDAARVILEHSDEKTTQIYAERDLEAAAEIMREIG